jgi:hypothetical protein
MPKVKAKAKAKSPTRKSKPKKTTPSSKKKQNGGFIRGSIVIPESSYNTSKLF